MHAKMIVSVGVLLVLGASHLGCEQSSTATQYPGRTFYVGGTPESIAVADLNGDGVPDIITANRTYGLKGGFGDVSVLLGRGDGSFEARTDYSLGGPTVFIRLGDVNGDSFLDAVTLDRETGEPWVLLGYGDGSFGEAYSIHAGLSLSTFVLASLNGDGVLDLVATSYSTDEVLMLRGNGEGSFEPPVILAQSARPVSIAIEDMNGDSKLDVVFSSWNEWEYPPPPGNVGIMLANGDGTFQTPIHHTVGPAPSSLIIADVNMDRMPDIAVIHHGTSEPYTPDEIAVLEGNGDGSFKSHRTISMNFQYRKIAFEDVDSNGTSDLVSVVAEGVLIALGKGDGYFRGEVSYSAGHSSVDVALEDLDNDGTIDLAVSNYLGEDVSILLGYGDGTFPTRLTFETSRYPTGISLEDMNQDGILDVITTNSSASILLGNGDGTFGEFERYSGLSDAKSSAVVDVDRDGLLDVLLLTEVNLGELAVLLGRSDGSLLDASFSAARTRPRSFAVADVNHDGNPDVVVSKCDFGDMSLLLGNGDGTFQDQICIGDAYAGTRFVALGDVDEDGNVDIVSTRGGVGFDSEPGQVVVHLGDGSGQFDELEQYSVGIRPDFLALADVDGDSMIDVVCVNRNSDSMTVLLGGGDGTFRSSGEFFVGRSPTHAVVADVDEDGIPDVVTANSGGFELLASFASNLSILIGQGDGTFSPPQNFTAGFSPQAVAVADVNGDGRVDIIAANTEGDDISVLLLQ